MFLCVFYLIWNLPQPPTSIIVEGLGELFVGVHDERPVPGDWLADGQATHDVHVEGGCMTVLSGVCAEAISRAAMVRPDKWARSLALLMGRS